MFREILKNVYSWLISAGYLWRSNAQRVESTPMGAQLLHDIAIKQTDGFVRCRGLSKSLLQ